MKHEPDIQEPGIFEEEDPAVEAEADARAEEDIAAGRVYPHAVVAEWLKTWGTPGRKPFHEWLEQAKA